jgi:hypothetical protein
VFVTSRWSAKPLPVLLVAAALGCLIACGPAASPSSPSPTPSPSPAVSKAYELCERMVGATIEALQRVPPTEQQSKAKLKDFSGPIVDAVSAREAAGSLPPYSSDLERCLPIFLDVEQAVVTFRGALGKWDSACPDAILSKCPTDVFVDVLLDFANAGQGVRDAESALLLLR